MNASDAESKAFGVKGNLFFYLPSLLRKINIVWFDVGSLNLVGVFLTSPFSSANNLYPAVETS